MRSISPHAIAEEIQSISAIIDGIDMISRPTQLNVGSSCPRRYHTVLGDFRDAKGSLAAHVHTPLKQNNLCIK